MHVCSTKKDHKSIRYEYLCVEGGGGGGGGQSLDVEGRGGGGAIT